MRVDDPVKGGTLLISDLTLAIKVPTVIVVSPSWSMARTGQEGCRLTNPVEANFSLTTPTLLSLDGQFRPNGPSEKANRAT